jgi:hypothetical protein
VVESRLAAKQSTIVLIVETIGQKLKDSTVILIRNDSVFHYHWSENVLDLIDVRISPLYLLILLLVIFFSGLLMNNFSITVTAVYYLIWLRTQTVVSEFTYWPRSEDLYKFLQHFLHQNVVVFTCNPDTQQAKIGRIEV